MAQLKVSQLTGEALDWTVWMIDHSHASTDDELLAALSPFNPSTNWAQGGPIIERERIQFRSEQQTQYRAFIGLYGAEAVGKTHLQAAMRCYVASKLGETIEVPDSLTP